MKIYKLMLALFIIPFLMVGGCQDKSLEYRALERDNYKTGGNLTFAYDEISHTAIFGGEGETVQFYSVDFAKGWTKEGCRVGVQLSIPSGIDDFKSGTAIIDETELSAEDYLVQTEENNFNYAIFQPIVSKQKSQIDLKIIWQEGFEEQIYHIIIKDGTNFMDN